MFTTPEKFLFAVAVLMVSFSPMFISFFKIIFILYVPCSAQYFNCHFLNKVIGNLPSCH